MRNVLFVIQSLVHYRIFESYITEVSKLDNIKLSFIIVKKELETHREYLSLLGKVESQYKLNEKSEDATEKSSSHFTKKIKSFLYPLNFFKKSLGFKKKAKRILEEFKPDVIFFSSERYINFEIFLASCAYKKRIKTLLLGVDYFYVEEFSGYLKNDESREIKTLMQKLFAWWFPGQSFIASGKKCLYYPWFVILTLWLTGSLPFKPYIPGSSFISDVFMDLPATKDVYTAENVLSTQIHVTGHLDDPAFNSPDEMIEDVPLKEIAIYAVPQMFEHGLADWDSHIQSIEQSIEIFRPAFKKVFVSLHPKMDLGKYNYLEDKFDVEIFEKKLANEIHKGGVFISTYSSTVLWAFQMGMPVILLDLFGLNYSYFETMKHVVKIRGYEDMRQCFNNFSSTSEDLFATAKKYKEETFTKIRMNPFDDVKNIVLGSNL